MSDEQERAKNALRFFAGDLLTEAEIDAAIVPDDARAAEAARNPPSGAVHTTKDV